MAHMQNKQSDPSLALTTPSLIRKKRTKRKRNRFKYKLVGRPNLGPVMIIKIYIQPLNQLAMIKVGNHWKNFSRLLLVILFKNSKRTEKNGDRQRCNRCLRNIKTRQKLSSRYISQKPKFTSLFRNSQGSFWLCLL